MNQEPLDVTLDKEKVLSDVVDELFRLIHESGFRIYKIEHNGKELTPEDRDTWAHLPLENIGTLDVSVKTTREALFEHLNTVRQFLSITRLAFEKRNTSLLAELSSEYSAVLEALDPLMAEPKRDTSFSRLLDDQVKKLEVFSSHPLYQDESGFTSLLDSILAILAERMREVSAPAEELKKSGEALKALLGSLRDVSVLLQTGKDREAMGSLLSCIELVSKIIRLYPLILDESGASLDTLSVCGKSFSEFYTGFNAILQELIEAFTVNDSVLIGDLLEYEVAPKLEMLLPSIEFLASNEEQQ